MTVNNDWMTPYLSKDERYCRRCGYINTKKRFGTDGVGHGVCPLCKAYQAFVRDEVIPIEKQFRKHLGPNRIQKTCPRCGKVLRNENNGEHFMVECDEILQQTWEVCNS